jgi:hypothetical protein
MLVSALKQGAAFQHCFRIAMRTVEEKKTGIETE